VHLYIDASLCYLNWDDCLLFFGLRRKSWKRLMKG
jgi:hypothetical protein